MKRCMIPVYICFISFVLCIALLLVESDAHAYTDGEPEPSDTISRPLFAEGFALPPARYRASEVPENTAKSKQWEIEFISLRKNPVGLQLVTGKNLAGSTVQKGSYKVGTYSLLAELGEIEISTPPVPFKSLTNKGGRLSFHTGFSGNSLRLSAFTATNNRYAAPPAAGERTSCDSILAGMSGEFGFFAEKARIGTSFVTGGETTRPQSGETFVHGRAGKASKFFALLDPFTGRLTADAEVVLSTMDNDLADTSGAVHVATHKLKIGGDLGIAGIPMHWEYRKLISTGSMDPSGVSSYTLAADTVSGNVRYKAGPLDIGLQAAYSRQNRQTISTEETSKTSFVFSPQLLLGSLTLSPSFSLDRRYSYLTNLHTETYAFNLGAKGCLLESKLDCELRGSYRQLDSGYSATKHTVATNFRIPAPFLNFFTLFGSPSLDIKGEYSRAGSEAAIIGQNDFTLFVTLSSI
jgi:hypothetical protein